MADRSALAQWTAPGIPIGRAIIAMRPTLLLLGGRTLGFVAALAIPIILARRFDQAQFGTYRQLFLLYATAYGFAQVGMAESLYYFLPRRPEQTGPWVGNAVAALGVMGLSCVGLALLLSPAIARWFHNPALLPGVPLVASFLALMLVATTLEIVMVSRKRHGLAAMTYAGSDVMRAVMLLLPAVLTGRVDALLMGAIAFGLLRCVALAGYLKYEVGAVRTNGRLLRVQLGYALPFAAAVTVEVIQLNFHQYAVASWFDSAAFAIYSVGCLQIPLVDIFATSASSVMMVAMSEETARGRSPVKLWHETVDRLACVFFPLVVVLLLTAHEVITFLFTAAYAASTSVFMIFSLTFALAAVPVDAVLRVYAQTRFLLVLNLVRLACVVSLIGWCVSRWQLPGAVMVTVFAMAVARVLALWRIAKLMGVGFRGVLPWGSLARTLMAALAAAVPTVVIARQVPLPALPVAALQWLIYGLLYVALAVAARSAFRAAPSIAVGKE